VEELHGKVAKFAEESAAWKKEMESWEEEKKRLGTWKVCCSDSEGKLNKRIADLEVDYDKLKEKYEGVEGELDDLRVVSSESTSTGSRKDCGKRPSFTRMLMQLIQGLMLIKMWWMASLLTRPRVVQREK